MQKIIRIDGMVESEALPDDAALRAAIEDLGFDCLSIENA